MLWFDSLEWSMMGMNIFLLWASAILKTQPLAQKVLRKILYMDVPAGLQNFDFHYT